MVAAAPHSRVFNGDMATSEMSTNGIQSIFLETHSWKQTAEFLQALGYSIDFETDHNSGQLRNAAGPNIFVAEVPADQPVRTTLALEVPDADAFLATAPVEVVEPFTETHYGTREMTVRDPDGRIWSLQAPLVDPS